MPQDTPQNKPIRLAIAGLGAIGFGVVAAVQSGRLPGFEIGAVSARDQAAARARLAEIAPDVPVVAIDELEPLADMVVECAPAALFEQIVGPFVCAGKKAVVLSVGAILGAEHLVTLAADNGGQIIAPSGALLALDAVTAAAEGNIESVRMITRKPVSGLLGAPYLAEHGIDIAAATGPIRVFSGSARDAARGFPANLNVGAALALSGIGPDRTTIEIWADPALSRNTHTIEVVADSASFSMSIENVPSANPKTGRITALSVIATLRKMTAPLRLGT
ncbi:aspartate dehydrogenase [Salipiger sp. 1_MG-2023]|uniref:aspartate dehydrogenase n=1 Tax=Salipiger sp. 1_MG-2023 TaxID=3062665 RepID=UPI0026E48D75|nr:aspartate dehydrogenase [Salipiger sp. 1_MG-2023]MDO6585853.1 aspartate dehydrogenase [Salipiger sp. 1_MG-2023]